jgi:enoyl-CoA hydratase/carnithine racemase
MTISSDGRFMVYSAGTEHPGTNDKSFLYLRRLDQLEAKPIADPDGLARITLHRPERLNAFTNRMQRELCDAFDRVDADPDVRAVVVTGSGRGFCSGADLGSGERTFSGGKQSERSGRDPGGVVALRIFDCTKPVIGAVNGPAIGVGASITLPMDARFAAPNATFGFVFTRLGIAPEACSSWFLPRLVGIPTALDWLMSGRTISATEAQSAGLVQQLADDVVAAATRYARDMVRGTAPVSVALARQLVWRMATVDSPTTAHRVDSALLLTAAAAPDAREGVAAFRERRAPEFPMRVPNDLPPAYPWWEPDEWRA